MYFNVNYNVFFKLINGHLLVSELYMYQNARCNDKKKTYLIFIVPCIVIFYGITNRCHNVQ